MTKEENQFLFSLHATMRHAQIFLRSREKMHPIGIEQYDELLSRLTDWITTGRLPDVQVTEK